MQNKIKMRPSFLFVCFFFWLGTGRMTWTEAARLPLSCGIRSGLLSSLATLKRADDVRVVLGSGHVALAAERIVSGDAAEGAPLARSVTVEPLDLVEAARPVGSRRIRRQRRRRAITSRATKRNSAETAPVTMATKGLMAISLVAGAAGRDLSPDRDTHTHTHTHNASEKK